MPKVLYVEDHHDTAELVLGNLHREALQAAAPILLQEDLVKKGTDLNKVINDLIDPSFVQSLAPKKPAA